MIIKKNHIHGFSQFQTRISLLFLMLAGFLLLLTGYYWLYVMEPKLDTDSHSYATALASADALNLAGALEPKNNKIKRQLSIADN